eukprot:4962751-Amphidinium_carterae.1
MATLCVPCTNGRVVCMTSQRAETVYAETRAVAKFIVPELPRVGHWELVTGAATWVHDGSMGPFGSWLHLPRL